MDVKSSMLSSYQPRRVVREVERERPSEVDSKTDQRIVDGGGSTRWFHEVVPRGGPRRRLIPRRLENPEEADYTSQRMHFCSAAVVPASLLLRKVILD